MLCDRGIVPRLKGKICQVAVRPAKMYGLETLTTANRHMEEFEAAEMSMLHFTLGVGQNQK